jgi:hypothetical protein
LGTLAITGCGSNAKKNADAPTHDDAGSDGAGAPSTVVVTVEGIPTSPTNNFIAMFQDGSGAWHVAPAPTNGMYTLTINSATWGFGFACAISAAVAGGTATEADVILVNYTVAERTSFTEGVPLACRNPGTAPITVTGSITHLPAVSTGTYEVWFGGTKSAVTVAGTTGTFTLTNIPPVKRDLFVVHRPAVVGAGGSVADFVARVTGVDETGSGSAVTVNWTAAPGSGGSAATQTATGSGTTSVDTVLYTRGGTDPTLSSSATTSAYLATSQVASSDVYEQLANYNLGGTIFAEEWVNAVVPPALTEPATLNGIIPSESATTPYPILTTNWDSYGQAVSYIWFAQETLAGSVPGTGSVVSWGATLSPGYVGATPSYVMPDLSAISGWMPSMQFTGGNSNKVTVAVSPSLSSAGVDDMPFSNPAPVGTTRGRTVATAIVTLQ